MCPTPGGLRPVPGPQPKEGPGRRHDRGGRRKLAADGAALTLGQCFELIGEATKGREQYTAALGARPQDAPILRTAADFHLRINQATDATALLRELIDHAQGPRDS